MTLKLPIYLDNNATTAVDPRVLEKMIPYFTEHFGNAASRNHPYGWTAEEAVEKAREQIGAIIGASSKEMVITSGATESNNLAILGVAEMYKEKGNHIITCVTEHKAVLDPCKHLEESGNYNVTWLQVDKFGQIDLAELEKSITDKTILISIMYGNNEIGSLQPIEKIGQIAKKHGVIFHTDATQAVGRMPIDVEKMGIDLLSMSAHKIYGPKGIGALYVRRKSPRVKLSPIQFGGGHERGMRSGTLNVPGIVGFGEACRLAKEEMATEIPRLIGLRERLYKKLSDALEDIYLNGHPTERLPGNLNVSFAYVEGESLLMGIKEIAVSSGSACTSASLEPSYVLKSLGASDEIAHSSIRFGIGRFTTQEEVDFTADRVIKEVKRLRELSPLYEMVKEGIDLKTVQWTGH
jgi:cysteine desulfurase